MPTHELKTWPEYFYDVEKGVKPFEVRVNDRNFQMGDTLILKEFDPEREKRNGNGYTGRELTRIVTYILQGERIGIKPGYCVMGLKK